jgi:hypothetical protein
VDERERRVAENEVLFNTVNEQILSLGEALPGDGDAPFSIICECGNDQCTERIELDRAVYQDVRLRPAQFIVLRGHEIPDTEHVIGEATSYLIVEKDEPLKSILEERDLQA